MRFIALGSSSAGNCFVMELDMGEGREPVSLMVECGFPYHTIVRKATRYNVQLSNVCGCLITHSHKDHSLAAADLTKRGIQIYATEGTLGAIGLNGQGWPMHYGKPTPITRGVMAAAFRVEHDAPDPAGFIIKTKRETIVFAIDACKWLDDLSAFEPDYLCIEANYDRRLLLREQQHLRERMNYSDMQKYRHNERIMASHMSIDGCLAQITKIKKTKLKAIFLMHLSDRNSAPSFWKEQAMAISGVPVKVCRKDEGIE